MKIFAIILVLILLYVICDISFGESLRDFIERKRIDTFLDDNSCIIGYILGKIDGCDDKSTLISMKEKVDADVNTFANLIESVCPLNPYGKQVSDYMRELTEKRYEEKLKSFENGNERKES